MTSPNVDVLKFDKFLYFFFVIELKTILDSEPFIVLSRCYRKFSKLLLFEDSPLVFCIWPSLLLLCVCANTCPFFMQRVWLVVHGRLLVIKKGDTTRSREVPQWVKHFLCKHEDLSSNPQNPWKARHSGVRTQSPCFYNKRSSGNGAVQKLRELLSLVCASAHNKENLAQTRWNACSHTHEYTHKRREAPPMKGRYCI